MSTLIIIYKLICNLKLITLPTRDQVLLLSLLIFSFSYFAESIEVLDLQIQSQYEDIKLIPGRILPTNISELAFEIPGKVAVVNSDLGDFVKEGRNFS